MRRPFNKPTESSPEQIEAGLDALLEKYKYTKAIFVDVDGCLNNTQTLIEAFGGFTEANEDFFSAQIDNAMLNIFADIVKRTGAKVVLSSTWRLYKIQREVVYKAFASILPSYTVVGITPVVSGPRSNEIKDWLERHPVVKYAVIDDDTDAGIGIAENFFRCDHRVGLTKEIAEEVISHLGAK